MSNKSKFINSGSQGCIFSPNIPCKKNESTPKKSVTPLSPPAATKLIVYKERDEFKQYNEFHMNIMIAKIKGHDKWTIIWDKKCKSPEYKELKKISEIDKCLEKKELKAEYLTEKKTFTLFQGKFARITSYYYMTKQFPHEVFSNKQLFINTFLELFRSCRYLFIGLVELNKHNICHHDINKRNILFHDGVFKLIDYGISFTMNYKPERIIDRMEIEFHRGRIYESYPFEYIYYPPIPDKKILEEQDNIALRDYRSGEELFYEPIHHQLFKRDTDNLRFEMLEDKLHQVHTTISITGV